MRCEYSAFMQIDGLIADSYQYSSSWLESSNSR
jgi:hypothetical protein